MKKPYQNQFNGTVCLQLKFLRHSSNEITLVLNHITSYTDSHSQSVVKRLSSTTSSMLPLRPHRLFAVATIGERSAGLSPKMADITTA